jgi:hypothetical protein
MATYQIIYWRDIPAQVKARTGRERLSGSLGNRFQEAIDEAAMRAKTTGTDDYLEEWRSSDWQEREGETAVVVADVLAELEAAYPDERLRRLVENGGKKE